MRVAVGIRVAGSWTYDWSSTDIRPPDSAAYVRSSAAIQSPAAPIPRTGSSCAESVCRVPKETSLRTVASIRSWSISLIRERSSREGDWAVAGGRGPHPDASDASAGRPSAATPAPATVAVRTVLLLGHMCPPGMDANHGCRTPAMVVYATTRGKSACGCAREPCCVPRQRQPPSVCVTARLCECRLIIRPAQAACWYSYRVPPSRSRRWTSRCAICPGSVIGSGSGRSGAAWPRARCGRCPL